MDDRRAIEALVSHYLAAYGAHDANGCAEIYTPDALVMSPWEPPARGKKAIAAVHLDWFGEGETEKTMAIDELHIEGDIAFCLLRYEANLPNSGRVFGVSLNTFQRQSGGNWKARHTSICELKDNKTGFTN